MTRILTAMTWCAQQAGEALVQIGRHLESRRPWGLPMNKPEDRSSILRAELKRLSEYNQSLALLIQSGEPLTAKRYLEGNYRGYLPEYLDPKEAEIVNLLTEYEALQQQPQDAVTESTSPAASHASRT
jgi:hypothetical protein